MNDTSLTKNMVDYNWCTNTKRKNQQASLAVRVGTPPEKLSNNRERGAKIREYALQNVAFQN